MAIKGEATVDDLYRVEGKAEIVDGEIVLMSAACGLHGYAAGVIYASLLEYARRTKSGYALPDKTKIKVEANPGGQPPEKPSPDSNSDSKTDKE